MYHEGFDDSMKGVTIEIPISGMYTKVFHCLRTPVKGQDVTVFFHLTETRICVSLEKNDEIKFFLSHEHFSMIF